MVRRRELWCFVICLTAWHYDILGLSKALCLQVCTAIKKNTSLTNLNISWAFPFSFQAKSTLFSILPVAATHHFDFNSHRGNHVDSLAVEALENSLRTHPSLKVLGLGSCDFGVDGMHTFEMYRIPYKTYSGVCVHLFDISFNLFADNDYLGGTIVSQILATKHRLQSVDISRNWTKSKDSNNVFGLISQSLSRSENINELNVSENDFSGVGGMLCFYIFLDSSLGLHFGSKKTGIISIVFEDVEKFSIFSNRSETLLVILYFLTLQDNAKHVGQLLRSARGLRKIKLTSCNISDKGCFEVCFLFIQEPVVLPLDRTDCLRLVICTLPWIPWLEIKQLWQLWCHSHLCSTGVLLLSYLIPNRLPISIFASLIWRVTAMWKVVSVIFASSGSLSS